MQGAFNRPLHVGVFVFIHGYNSRGEVEFAAVHKNEKTFKKGDLHDYRKSYGKHCFHTKK